MFIGAVLGMAFSHLPGLPMIAGVAMGIGAMTAVMLGLPLTAVLLTSLFLQADGLALTPLVIVSVAVSYVCCRLARARARARRGRGSSGSRLNDESRAPGAVYPVELDDERHRRCLR